ncbi:hypothetical protein PsorP6_011337 [Peronosclerospora sorghi]|uniref:Uncharacterized protein n=1 Tax=Peronosclerospora sorghi TaxID=230839 RepID=A0ACC0WLI4_9STRA|nr:hypothetical protein PsorP6_011337 [Peronosclerospora sorghi]
MKRRLIVCSKYTSFANVFNRVLLYVRFLDMVLDDNREITRYCLVDLALSPLLMLPVISEITPEGRREVKLDQVLLNGNNVCLLVPGGLPANS